MPTANSGNRLSALRVFQYMILLCKTVHDVALPSEVTGECCSGICCKLGESCARSLTGPRCWPGVGATVAEADMSGNEVHTNEAQDNDLVVTKRVGVAPMINEFRDHKCDG
jgi:hypothetical protein